MKIEFKKEVVEKYLRTNKITKTKFCKLCGISAHTLEKVMNNKNYRITALFKIAKVIKIEVHQMFGNN